VNSPKVPEGRKLISNHQVVPLKTLLPKSSPVLNTPLLTAMVG